jgi:hypothetical protein
MECWEVKGEKIICADFFKISKKGLNMQGACHSPNVAPTMVHGQTSLSITEVHIPFPHREGIPYPPPRNMLSGNTVGLNIRKR